ncbi:MULTISPECIES: hypothetical protein [Thalassospira]|uniref:Uncharacterized protein n=1 Tax=Thalassospira xiamenensis TaxID=220697 RepID=A0ABR5Y3P0_9PROT|nr:MULTISPECIES: hypothetical protein [Thalassospira]KZD04050.1 hypothetical protein AUP40_16680 [Thalassospira xiamenensis]KZD10600.1 hypothetical protein AUP45_10160 [Thalassospira xiamenensis]MAB32958.1 hypothetical protein [Thalassospira sp.]MAL29745.1 hypothetical protein [Thalassospira sp.]MBA06944.1 hypothetical protein [Thalassospira sp.]
MTTIRTIQKTYAFHHPFHLKGFDHSFPAGSYNVETEEEMLEGLSFVSYKRTGTTLHMIRTATTIIEPKIFNIDPRDFDLAVLRDRHQCAEETGLSDAPSMMSRVDKLAIERGENEGMTPRK